MSDWWQFGLEGRNGVDSIPATGGVYQVDGYNNLEGYRSGGSFSLEDGLEGHTYRRLITTLNSGTQIYLEGVVRKFEADVHLPDERVNYLDHGFRLVLRKDGVELTPAGTGLVSGPWGRYIAGDANVYNFLYRQNSGNIPIPGMAYPKGRSGAGTTNQIAMTTSGNGITFWVVGYSGYNQATENFNPCPAQPLGTISDQTLNNRYWFDPELDGMTEAEMRSYDNSGQSPDDRPSDPSYQGDDIDFPDLPSGANAIGFGRMKLYHCSGAQLASALDILWSDASESSLEQIIETCKKWWYKPEQYCVSLMLTPVPLTDGASHRIYFGKYDTQVDAPVVGSQYVVVDCGSVSVPMKTSSFLDFAPATRASIYLPFVGFRNIGINEIMGGTVYVKYYVDLFTGSALCMVRIANQNCNSSILYTYECNVQEQIPITSENYNQVISGLLTAGVSAGMGNYGMASATLVQSMNASASPDVNISGALNPNTGILGHPKPYVILHFPVQDKPNSFEDTVGRSSNKYLSLGAQNGYVEVERIHLNIPGASDIEVDEIERLLSEGVLF